MKDLNPKISWTIFIMATVLILGALGYCIYKFYPDVFKNNIATTTTPTSMPTASTTIEMLTPKGKSIVLANTLNTNDKDQTFRSFLYDLSDSADSRKDYILPEWLTTSSYQGAYRNDSVQWGADGKTMAYSYGDEGGMSSPETPNSFKLKLINNNKETTVLENCEVVQVPKWLLMPDGKSIVYIKSDENKIDAKYSLYKFDISLKQHAKLDDNVSNYAHTGSGLQASQVKNAVYMINNKEQDKYKKIYKYEYSIDNKVSSEVMIYENSSARSLSTSSIWLSPDEKFAAFDIQTSDYEFTINLLNIANGAVTEVVKSGDRRAFSHISWSHDGKYITVDQYPYGTGNGGSQEKQLWRVNISTKTKTVLDTSSEGLLYNAIWSPDNNYIAYIKNKGITIYDFTNKLTKNIYNNDQSIDTSTMGIAWVGF